MAHEYENDRVENEGCGCKVDCGCLILLLIIGILIWMIVS